MYTSRVEWVLIYSYGSHILGGTLRMSVGFQKYIIIFAKKKNEHTQLVVKYF